MRSGGSSKKVLIGVAAGLLALAGAGGWYLYQRSNNPQTSIGTAITAGANSSAQTETQAAGHPSFVERFGILRRSFDARSRRSKQHARAHKRKLRGCCQR